jgi:hypothetical protein|tara:strand:- start:5547 stop:5759 length:213 start_codon:yes stop_codon:yes gene_type:complete
MTKSSLIPVEGHPNFCRDKNTGAIINTDSSSFAAYQQRNSQKKMERLEIDNMKKDISDIKDMLSKIASKL